MSGDCCAQGPTGVPSTIISFAQKTYVQGTLTSKLHVIELGAGPGLHPWPLMPDAGADVFMCICCLADSSAAMHHQAVDSCPQAHRVSLSLGTSEKQRPKQGV